MSRGRSIACLLGLVVLSGAIWQGVERPLPAGASATLERSVQGEPPAARDPEAQDPGESGKMIEEWRAFQEWLKTGPSPDRIRAKLLAIRERWVAGDSVVLAQVIQELLRTGDDATLPLEFEVGPHGSLDGWPSLRVFLLDALNASDPDLSSAMARKELAETRSAEEFAVALRCLVRKGPGQASPAELQGLFSRMLAEPTWRKSVGLAEALDVARVIGTVDAARELLAWPGESGLKRMAMDEFAAEHPAEMIEALTAAGSQDPTTRADLMARIDPSDPEQLEAVDGYLRNPSLTAEESTAFLRMFPLRSTTTGHRLYGGRPAPYSRETVLAGDKAALEQVSRWLADPALEKHQVELQSLQSRLSKWVQQVR